MSATTRSVLYTVLGAGTLGALTLFWVRYQEQRGIFFPTSYHRSQLNQLPERIEWVTFRSEDDLKLTGLWKNGHPDSPVMILAHGNAGHMLHRAAWLDQTVPAGWNGFIFDYRGYGLSEGTPSEKGLYRDTLAAVRFARFRNDNPRLFLHGRSMGVPMVAYASQHELVSGLILESGFPRASDVAKSVLGLPGISYLLTAEFDTIEYLEKATDEHGPIPKFIIHGKDDHVLPFELGKKLYREAPDPKEKWWIPGAGHNDLSLVAGREYTHRIGEFLKDVRRE